MRRLRQFKVANDILPMFKFLEAHEVLKSVVVPGTESTGNLKQCSRRGLNDNKNSGVIQVNTIIFCHYINNSTCITLINVLS